MDEQRQREIAQGLREGQTDAWFALYDAYCRQVWNHVARLMGPHSADIADVVQETFLAAARSAGFPLIPTATALKEIIPNK